MTSINKTIEKAASAAGAALNEVCQHLHLSEDETKEVFEIFTEEFGRAIGSPEKKKSKKNA